MEIKPGVRLIGLQPQVVLAATIAGILASQRNLKLVITSGVEGEHIRASLHYPGAAIDLRSRDWSPDTASDFAVELARRLGDDFDVVLARDHIHLEWQPKDALL